ncbi:MAG: YceI family protein [Polyangiaceae bacterium]
MKSFSKSLVLLGVAMFVPAVAATADAKLGGASDAKVEVVAKGPGGLNIVGRSGALTVKDDGTNVVVEVPIAPIKTGIDLRDEHMKKHLEAETYPTAVLTVPRAALKFPAGGAASGDAQGSVQIHGQTKTVSFHYDADKKGGAIGVRGSMNVAMSDFGIKTPKYLGVGVSNDVAVTVAFSVSDG